MSVKGGLYDYAGKNVRPTSIDTLINVDIRPTIRYNGSFWTGV